ncbi:cytochrome P450 2F2-like [Hemibagrus wyckioides]|uniref:cytochrome P450 2F2-like n=1 Tax=Hemibagrus wyckioides TaxID=337641 RepID=UPI00266C52D2|nr:cytochrome P450 2F2-like [Hemibagrus wyckioides]
MVIMLCSLTLVGFCLCFFYVLIRIQRPKNSPPGATTPSCIWESFSAELWKSSKTHRKGSVLCPHTLFHDATSNIINLILSGTRYNYNDDTLKKHVKFLTEKTKILNGPWSIIYDTLPCVRSLPLPFKKAFTFTYAMDKLTMTMINNHKTTKVKGEPRDFVDCYLDELEMLGTGLQPSFWVPLL